ncbi:MAG: methyltransferase domain-containing protein [Acidimicrobiia bacterium]
MTTYDKYAWGTTEEAARKAAASYERYLVPSIGRPSARPVIEAATLRVGERVLDVACGTGVAARLAAEQVAPTGTVVGVDPHPGMLEVARGTSPDVEWRHGRAEDLPLPDESFNAVVCSLGFQFFADKGKALQEMRRVLVPGGRVALGTPGPTPPLMTAIDDALIEHIGPEASVFVQAVFSVHDPDQLRFMLDAAGFDDVEIDTGSVLLRVPPPADFFWQFVLSTPLAGIATEIDDDTRAALERDVVERCEPFLDGDSLVMEPRLLLATARRGRVSGHDVAL